MSLPWFPSDGAHHLSFWLPHKPWLPVAEVEEELWPSELPGAKPKMLRILGNGRKLSLNADWSCVSLKPRQTLWRELD